MTNPHAPSWFTAPDSRFRTAAFWFWHFLPTEEQCLQTIRDMKAAGLGCVLVQARLPLPLETYLSDAYLARCRFVARQVHKAGMRLEIYDEYGWMSGHGGAGPLPVPITCANGICSGCLVRSARGRQRWNWRASIPPSFPSWGRRAGTGATKAGSPCGVTGP
ncbi:hypothetical protein RAA17_01610 [Komagataeibacter rhaeticus]|nr:hypothetical protein [Komagataeibacter rhaeticus]